MQLLTRPQLRRQIGETVFEIEEWMSIYIPYKTMV